jgi:hypothetical protein
VGAGGFVGWTAGAAVGVAAGEQAVMSRDAITNNVTASDNLR